MRRYIRKYYHQSIKRFPLYGKNLSAINNDLKDAIQENIDYSKDYILGYPASVPSKIAVKSLNKFLELNPNNIGTHTRIESEAGFKGTQKLEREVIAMIADLFNSNNTTAAFDGYISSGGTESNIMGLWLLRNMISITDKSEVYFLKTPLTHYSIKKAFNLLNINNFSNIDVNGEFVMDIKKLEKKIRALHIDGFKNFVIICTLGYTVTGSIDLIQEIDSLVNDLQKELGMNIFIHIDAAFGGFIYPFLVENKIGFNLKNVMTIGLDAHKTGLMPYSCGVFLCRKNLQRFIETDVDYIRSHYDDTLIGSRSGAMAAALWGTIMFYGKDGYSKIYFDCIENKNYLIQQFKKNKIRFWHYTNKMMNIIAIEFLDISNNKLPIRIERKYGLNLAKVPFGNGSKNVYKLAIMPHVKKGIVDQFVLDLKMFQRKNKKTGEC